MWEKLGRFVQKYRRQVVAFWVIYVLAMAFLGRNVEVSYHFAKMLPEDDSVYTEFVALSEHFEQGSGGVIFLAAHLNRSSARPGLLYNWKPQEGKSQMNLPPVKTSEKN